MQEDKGSLDAVNLNISLTDSSSMLTLAASPSKNPTNKPQSFQPPDLKTSNLLHQHILSGVDNGRDDDGEEDDKSEEGQNAHDGPCTESLALRPSPP